MRKDELDAIRAATDRARDDLTKMNTKAQDIEAEKQALVAERAELPLDEDAIGAHIKAEEAIKLRAEIVDRMRQKAQDTLIFHERDLAYAEWRYRHDQLQAESTEIEEWFKKDFIPHAKALCLMFAALKAFENKARHFRVHTMPDDQLKITFSNPLNGVRFSPDNDFSLIGPGGVYLWPLVNKELSADTVEALFNRVEAYLSPLDRDAI